MLGAQDARAPRVGVVAMTAGPIVLREQLALAVDSALRAPESQRQRIVRADTLIAYLHTLDSGYGTDSGFSLADRRAFGQVLRLEVLLEIVVSEATSGYSAGLSGLCVRTGQQIAPARLVSGNDWRTLVPQLVSQAQNVLSILAAERADSVPVGRAC